MAEGMVEKIVMELVVNGGDARSKAMAALRAARANRMDEAETLMRESQDALVRAHNFQTSIIQESLEDEDSYASLIMVHGQDHLMTAMVVKDLAEEMIEMYKMLYQMKQE